MFRGNSSIIFKLGSYVEDKRLGIVIIIVILCLNVLIFLFALGSESDRLGKEELLPYDFIIRDLPEQQVPTLRSNWKLLLLPVINVNAPPPILHYINVLYNKHKERGLEVVAIYTGTSEQEGYIKQKFGLSFAISNDAKQAWKKALRIDTSHPHGGIVIVDSNRKVKFASYEFPREHELRILVEKYLLGQVDYSLYVPRPYEFFRLGSSPPPLRVELITSSTAPPSKNAGAWLKSNTTLAGKSLAVFLADCSSCQVENYIKHLADLEQSNKLSQDLIAVFAPNFSGDSLKSNARRYGVNTPIYILQGEVPQIYDAYATRTDVVGAGPILVSFDREGKVRAVGPLFEKVRR